MFNLFSSDEDHRLYLCFSFFDSFSLFVLYLWQNWDFFFQNQRQCPSSWLNLPDPRETQCHYQTWIPMTCSPFSLFDSKLPSLIDLHEAICHGELSRSSGPMATHTTQEETSVSESEPEPASEPASSSEPPLSWCDIVHIVEVRKDLSLLKRNPAQERDYRTFRRDVDRQWTSLTDYLWHTKFHVPKMYRKNQWTVDRRSIATAASTQQIQLCRNDFPYHWAPNVEHWVLWKLGGTVTVDDIRRAKQELVENIYNNNHNDNNNNHNDNNNNHQSVVGASLHWINPPPLQSVLDIDHAHILVRLDSVTATP